MGQVRIGASGSGRFAAAVTAAAAAGHALGGALIDLVAAHRCAGCGAESVVLCPVCALYLAGRPWAVWPRPVPRCLPPSFTVARYRGPVPAVLRAYKEDAVHALARPLGEALGRAAVVALPGDGSVGVTVVPVPSRPAAVRRRGRDAVAALGRSVAGRLRSEGRGAVFVPALAHARRVRDQAGLGAAARAANVAGAFRVRRSCRRLVEGTSVLLVDDLITTGASLAEAARALRASGARVVGAVTVAAATHGGVHSGAHNGMRSVRPGPSIG